MEASTDRYWSNTQAKKTITKPVKEEVEALEFNVQKWLISSSFSDYDNGSTGSSSPPNLGAYYIDAPQISFGEVAVAQADSDMSPHKPTTYTLLQRDKNALLMHTTPKNCMNGKTDLSGFCKRGELKNLFKATYEDKMGGLTDMAISILEKIVADLKKTEFAEYISQVKTENHPPASNLDWILNKLKTKQYKYVNEVVRDLYYVVNFASIYYGNFFDVDSKVEAFVQRIQSMLETRLNHFDFSTISGLKDELVGPLKLKVSKLDGDGDHLN
ncbi:hypothetical protein WA026_001503 [Henosepilachna vigintioctopunctata]|uniref:Bromo domain-containing protein n=1 Tax=Henosepilachna vigintioctopunctata TaxID=420089 RepID=A0AAW1UTN4_9CUCU